MFTSLSPRFGAYNKESYFAVSGVGKVAHTHEYKGCPTQGIYRQTEECAGVRRMKIYLDIFRYVLVENCFHLAGIGTLGVADLAVGR